jgi:dihydrolipoamide dehydrogenase
VRDHLLISDDVFELHDLPRSLGVIGTGVIGLELGQAMHRLGVQTTFFSRSEHLGPLTDPMLRVEAASILGAELDLQLTSEPAVTRSADGFHLAWTDAAGRQRKARFDALLCATGRRANLEGPDPSRARVATVPAIDPHTLQLGNLPIFFAGDAGAYRPVLHEAAHEGIIAGINAARYRTCMPWRRTPLEIVHAAGDGDRRDTVQPSIAPGRRPVPSYANQGRARVMAERGPGAHLRAAQVRHADRRRDVRPARRAHAHLLAWAVQHGVTVNEALEMPVYHPVIEEGIHTALRDLCTNLKMRAPERPTDLECGPGA